ncbi:MAG TPA: hypothetical protein VFZ17_11760, partial [Acidimicrobiia bacterium]|nr:hypothetical protein [Acidimicrobiia bacterium]
MHQFAPELTGKADRAVSGLWLASLRAPEIAEQFDALGLDATERYFPARVAPLGPASLELTVATFFNFAPRAVARAIPGAWEKATPRQVLDAQLTGIDGALRRAFASLDEGIVKEALDLLRPVAEAAAEHVEGRPLFAGYASLPWPDEPHLALWHAHYLVREFRGDGHIAVLTADGITGVEALCLHIAQLPMLGPIFRQSRAWTDAEWAATVGSLRARGWLADGDELALSEQGAERRNQIEHRTDVLEVPAYAPIGQAGCERLIELGAPIAKALA